MTVNRLLTALVHDLAAGDVPHPLTQSLTLCTIWFDLCTLAGEEPPPAVLALAGAEAEAAVDGATFARSLLDATPAGFAGILAAEADRAYRRRD